MTAIFQIQPWLLAASLPRPVRDLANAYAKYAGVSHDMALALLLDAAVSALQRRYVIELPDGALEPIHRIDLVVAGPESGKDMLYRAIFAAHKAFDVAIRARSSDASANAARGCLTNTNKISDVIEAIAGNGQSTTVVQTDGGAMLDSSFFRRRAALTCDLWNGQSSISERDPKSKLRSATYPAVSFLAMPQPDPFQRYLSDHGQRAHDVGLLQRLLITFPSPHAAIDPFPPACMEEFQLDMACYLGDPMDYVSGEAGPVCRVPLAPDAERKYLSLLDDQKQARVAGAPAPWRWLQHVIRTALAMQFLVPHRANDSRLAIYGQRAGAHIEISLDSFDAACAYVGHNRDQEQMRSLMAGFATPQVPRSSTRWPASKPSAPERRRVQTVEDADEIMRKLDEYTQRHQPLDGVPVRALKARVGLYDARLLKALAYLEDEGHIVNQNGLLIRTRSRYQYWSAFPFSSPSGFGSL